MVFEQADHVKGPAPLAPPDKPEHFNSTVWGSMSPYAGDIGGLWCPHYVPYIDTFLASAVGIIPLRYNSIEAPMQTSIATYFIGCVTTSTMVNGDIVDDLLTPDGSPGQGLEGSLFHHPGHHYVRKEKLFNGGRLARFYPPLMNVWSATSLSKGTHVEGQPGRPFLTRQRGNKLWMTTTACLPVIGGFAGSIFFGNGILNGSQHWYLAHAGERVMVGDIYEEEDAPEQFSIENYNDFIKHSSDNQGSQLPPIAYRGKKFEVMYENPFIDTIKESCCNNHTQAIHESYPRVIGELYGVGNDSLFFIDDQTFSLMFQEDTGPSTSEPSSDFFGMPWMGKTITAIEVVPYQSSRTGTVNILVPEVSNPQPTPLPNPPHIDFDWNFRDVPRNTPHVRNGTILIAQMIYPDYYPNGQSGITGTGIVPFSTEDHVSHYPIRPAPRDTPWMVGKTANAKSLCCGSFIWDQDDPGHSLNGGAFTNSFRIDPRPEAGFAVIRADNGPEYNIPEFTRPGVLPEDDPIPILKGTVAYELHQLVPDNFEGSLLDPLPRTGLYGTSYTMECRGYDRMIANEHTGAIDCVLWTQGMLLKNDAFHGIATANDPFALETPQFPTPPLINFPTGIPIVESTRYEHMAHVPETYLSKMYDDFHVTVRNPKVLFWAGQSNGGDILDVVQPQDEFSTGNNGRHPVMEQPTAAGIWVRRWRVDAEERRLARPSQEYIPFNETPGADNKDADWHIERHNLLENAQMINPAWTDDGNQTDPDSINNLPRFIGKPTIPDPNHTGGGTPAQVPNPDFGWVPVSCCLTPYGDFCYVMLQPWPEDTYPFNWESIFYKDRAWQAGQDTPGFGQPGSKADWNKIPLRKNRYWRIVRPGHFDIKIRLAMPGASRVAIVDISHGGASTTAQVLAGEHRKEFGFSTSIRRDQDIWGSVENEVVQGHHDELLMRGDYTDSVFQYHADALTGLETLDDGADGNPQWERSKYPVSMSANEHFLTVRNMPAVCFGNFLNDEEKEFLGENPSNDDFEPFEPVSMSSKVLPYGEVVYKPLTGQEANTPKVRRHYAKSRTVRNEWQIDIATGEVRVPWSNVQVQFADPTSFYQNNVHDTIPINKLTKKQNDQNRLRMFIGPFTPAIVDAVWGSNTQEKMKNSSFSSSRIGPWHQDFEFGYYGGLEFNAIGSQSSEMWTTYIGTSSGFDTVQHVSGFTPPPINY